MRILYFHQYFCTPQGAGGVRSYEFARRWVAAGHDVTMITSYGYDETLRSGRCKIDGIDVRVIGGKYVATMGFMRRLWAFFSFALQSSWYALRARRYDVVLATSTPLTIAIPALIAKIFARRRVVFEVRDVWPDAAVDAGLLGRGVLYRIACFLEMAAYRKSDHIVALSDGMRERIISKGIAPNKISMLPNCSDINRFDPSMFDSRKLREGFGVVDEFVLLYVGAINTANDMPFIVKCMNALKTKKEVQWWFVGGGNQLDYLQAEVSKNGIHNVRFWGKRPKAEIPKFVNAADAGIVSFIPQPVYYENSPNKFFDYIAGGLPPIFTRTTWLKPYLQRVNGDLICERNSVDEFVAFVNTLVMDEKTRLVLKSNVLELAICEFSRDSISDRYVKLLDRIAKPRQELGI
jgi:glycosyltransferase involved in cell wall biosynthesis